MRVLVFAAVSGVCALAIAPLLSVTSCGGTTTTPAKTCKGDESWVVPASDPQCCAPPHNQFVLPEAGSDGGACLVVPGAQSIFRDDAGAGQRFPVGTSVNLTYCNSFYEGSPQPCQCEQGFADSGPSWLCPL